MIKVHLDTHRDRVEVWLKEEGTDHAICVARDLTVRAAIDEAAHTLRNVLTVVEAVTVLDARPVGRA